MTAPVPLAQADPAGGRKAHGLAVLMRAGVPVPDGFVVTDAAVDPRLVAGHLNRLRGRAVAVRSSGLSEDSATASCAGQFETVLGARGLDEVMAAIRRCAASPGTGRARGYRAHPRLAAGPTVPVLVQELVEADRAGVLFTRDPRDGADAVVINASWGLGESVVSGAVNPDEVIVTPRAVRFTIGAKQTRLDLRERGLVRSWVRPADRARGCVTSEEVSRLIALGRRCEEILGGAQDVEWAVRDDRIWLLQARPVTVGGAPAPAVSPGTAGADR